MDKKQLNELYEKNVGWLRRNVPPDDIYDFAEQTYMAALYFMQRYSYEVDFAKELKNNPITKKWAGNLAGLLRYRDEGRDVKIDMELSFFDEEDGA